MPKAAAHDKSVIYIIITVFMLVAAGLVSVWLYQRHTAGLRAETVYSRPLRVTAATGAYSVAATFVVRTNGEDADWVARHQSVLEQIVQRALVSGDPHQVLAPGGLQALQQKLRAAGNAALQGHEVQQIVITDFLIGDSSD